MRTGPDRGVGALRPVRSAVPWTDALRSAGAVLVRALAVTALVVGVVLRVTAVPSRYGADFVVWRLAADATLRGVDIFGHRPPYPSGPYAYLPLWAWIETPFAWLSQHSDLSFTVVGKLPIVAGDVTVASLIALLLRRRGCGTTACLLGAAAWFANPLVIYNGAWYGRFDSVALALLLAAVVVPSRSGRGWWSPVLFALSVAAKTFPVVALPLFARDGPQRLRTAAALVGTTSVLLWPYQHSLRVVLHDVLLYNVSRPPQVLSWQVLLVDQVTVAPARVVGLALLVAYVVSLFLLGRRLDAERFLAVALMLFLVVNKVVVEQYLIWPLPWLIVLAVTSRGLLRSASVGGAVALTVIGCGYNAFVHPFGQPTTTVGVILALVVVTFVLVAVTSTRGVVPRPRSAAVIGPASGS